VSAGLADVLVTRDEAVPLCFVLSATSASDPEEGRSSQLRLLVQSNSFVARMWAVNSPRCCSDRTTGLVVHRKKSTEELRSGLPRAPVRFRKLLVLLEDSNRVMRDSSLGVRCRYHFVARILAARCRLVAENEVRSHSRLVGCEGYVLELDG